MLKHTKLILQVRKLRLREALCNLPEVSPEGGRAGPEPGQWTPQISLCYCPKSWNFLHWAEQANTCQGKDHKKSLYLG